MFFFLDRWTVCGRYAATAVVEKVTDQIKLVCMDVYRYVLFIMPVIKYYKKKIAGDICKWASAVV